MAYNLRYPQIQPDNTGPAERMFKMQYGQEQKEKKQLMAKIQEYKTNHKKFAPEEVQFMQLKAMEMGIPFSTDVKTSDLHTVSVAGGEFLDKLLFDLIPDNAKEALFGRPMNESERKWASAAGTIGFLGGFAVPFGPANMMMKALRPKMVAMLGKNPAMLRSMRNSAKAMGFKNPKIFKDAVKAGRKGEGGAYSNFMKKTGTTPDDLVKQANKTTKTAGDAAKMNSYTNAKDVKDAFQSKIVNDPAFNFAVRDARSAKEYNTIAKKFMQDKGWGMNPDGSVNFRANAAMDKVLGDFTKNWAKGKGMSGSQSILAQARGLVPQGAPMNMNVGRYRRTSGGGLEQMPMGGAPPIQLGQGAQPVGLLNQGPAGLLGPTPGMNVSTWRGF